MVRRVEAYIQYYDDQVTEEYRWEILYIVFKVQEAVALLAAVQRVDYDAYGFLLSNQCGIDLGVDGEQLHDAPLAAQFVLDVDAQGRQIDGAVAYDLVQFCGTNQREHPSDKYVQDLRKIAALDGTLQPDKPGVDIEIPVRLDCNMISASRAYGIANILMDVANTEKEIDAQWSAYAESAEKEAVASGTLQCKFSLEPMSADLRHISVTPEVTEAIERLMVGNVWFSHIALAMSMHRPSTDSELVARRAFGQLVRSFFDSTRRSEEQAHIDYNIEL
ncbi:hypothetical protein PHYPSEUDO_008437 [Phytophthora pseudosyringae]|uniref:Uncharacterized protein n=1 Tax=Phytophthora pseudosyringae TaxID=221518 RepID=A0A8T1VEA9_9STRA|nr:hypothetical protein PHYPSEUDO_008437 [Phytophthora pseudosyringae]